MFTDDELFKCVLPSFTTQVKTGIIFPGVITNGQDVVRRQLNNIMKDVIRFRRVERKFEGYGGGKDSLLLG